MDYAKNRRFLAVFHISGALFRDLICTFASQNKQIITTWI
jgi:hypothetical protein